MHPARHAFGYNASETKRVAKSEAAHARCVTFGFNAEEHEGIDKAMRYDSPSRQNLHPLVEWGGLVTPVSNTNVKRLASTGTRARVCSVPSMP
jgi:hypothetical protein